MIIYLKKLNCKHFITSRIIYFELKKGKHVNFLTKEDQKKIDNRGNTKRNYLC